MRRLLTIGAAVLALQPAPVSAEDWIATLQTAGRYVAVETRDSLAFFASEWGLEIFSIADPTNPVRLSSTPTLGIASDLEIDDRYAYVADQGHGLLVYDCLDPGVPILVAEDSLRRADGASGNVGDLLRVDTILYVEVPGTREGLCIFNIVDPSKMFQPTYLKLYLATDSLIQPSVLERFDTLLYTFDPLGFWVADISDPGHPAVLGHYAYTDDPWWSADVAAASGDRLIMYDGLLLRQFDVTDPTAPVFTTSQIPEDTSDQPTKALVVRDLYIVDTQLVIASYATGLKTAAIPTDPADTLVIRPLFDTPGLAQGVRPSDSLMVIADGDGGVEVASFRAGSADSLGYYSQRGFTGILARAGRYLLCRGSRRVYLVDVANPSRPTIVDSVLLGRDIRSLRIWGNRLFAMELGSDSLGFYTRLLAYDITDISNPLLLGSYVSPFDSLGYRFALGLNFATDGHFTYHADIIFSVVDVSSPDSLYLAGRVPGYFGGQGGKPVLGNGRAYVDYGPTQGGLYVIDTEDPYAPDVMNPLGGVSVSYTDAILDDTLLLAVDPHRIFHVVSVADPLNIYEVARWGPSSANTSGGSILRTGDRVVFPGTGTDVPVVVLDVARPNSPLYVRSFGTPGRPGSLAADDSILYVDDFYGLTVIRHGLVTTVEFDDDGVRPRAFSVEQNYPNPFNSSTTIPFELTWASRVQIDIYNVLGQRVFARDLGILPAGIHSLTWDAVGNSDNDLPSGLYFYRVSASGTRQTRKMLLLR